MSSVQNWVHAGLFISSSAFSTALLGQAPVCSPQAQLTLDEISLLGVNTQTGAVVVTDTVWIPSEGRLGDSLFVRLSVSAPAASRGDSMYAIAALRLQLDEASQEGNHERAVEFPSHSVIDTTVALTPNTTVILGPFSTNHLIPWPGIAVNATANANPAEIVAEGGVLQVVRVGSTCTESLRDNRKRTRPVSIQYAE